MAPGKLGLSRLVFFYLFCTSVADECETSASYSDCLEAKSGVLLAHPEHCDMYIQCQAPGENTMAYIQCCAEYKPEYVQPIRPDIPTARLWFSEANQTCTKPKEAGYYDDNYNHNQEKHNYLF